MIGLARVPSQLIVIVSSSSIHEIVNRTVFIIDGALTDPSYSFPRSMEEEMKTKSVWLKGHTGLNRALIKIFLWLTYVIDFTSVSILWSQPVSGLQIKSPDGQWRWIRHMPNALVRTAS